MIKVYIGKVQNRIELDTLPESIIKYINGKKQSLSAYYFLFRVLKENEIIKDDSEVEFNKFGKPFFKNREIEFNISHSNDYFVIAISNEEVGVDIEKIREISESRIRKFQEKVFRNSIIDNNESVIKNWTIKESFLKLRGTGINLSLNEIKINEELMVVSYQKEKSYYKTIKFNDYFITVSSYQKNEIEFIVIKGEEL